MSWFNLWDGLKTKTCRYLLQRYLGQFFENNLNLEQLKVDLYNGKAVVENISLKVNALNELFEEQGWAFEVISGHVGCLTAMVPWNALMTNDSSLNISDLTITLRPVTRCQSGTTMLESMWSSVSSSMQMAEECMKQIDDDVPFLNHSNTLIGLEKFAETIDNVLNRIHANLTNTTLNIEYTLPKSSKKLIISFKANHVEYKNQTGYEKYTNLSKDPDGINDTDDSSPPLTSLPMIANHHLVTNELTIWTSEILNNERQTQTELDYGDGQLCKIVEFKGCQNFKISIKQTENIVGPKVNLEIIIDDIYFLLTPRQIHHLMRMSKGFNKDRPEDKMFKQYKVLKSERSHMVPNPTKMTGIIQKDGEWGTEAEYAQKTEYSYSDFKKSTKKSESVFSATSTNSMATSCSNTQINIGSSEKSGEILKFKIQIFKIVGVVLHNDILVETGCNIAPKDVITEQSFDNYSQIADDFFPSTRTADLENYFVPISDHNYLFLMVSSLLVNGNQQRYCQELTLKTTLSATMVDFSEIIDNVENPLISFDRKKNCHEGYHTRPEVVLSHTSSCYFKQNSNRSSNKVECILDDCSTDLDISIYDRLSALFGPSAFDRHCDVTEAIPEASNPMDIHIKCNLLKLHLRFPIVDGRPRTDPLKIPYWKKNIRDDYLSFDFQNILVEWKSYLSVTVDEFDGYYCDEASYEHILKCSSHTDLENATPGKEKIHIKVHNQDDRRLWFDSSQKPKRKTPFSSKCSYGYSSNVEGLNDINDKREIFLPGDTEEINDFCESTKNASSTIIYILIPKAKIVLGCKKLYEVIYNRLNGDLLMWEPLSPLYHDIGMTNMVPNRLGNNRDFQKFMNSQLMDASFSEETFISAIESTSYERPIVTEVNNMLSLELCIEEGKLIIFTDVQDLESKDEPNSRGKLQLNLKEFRLFSVAGFNNDKNLNYFCIQLNETDILHCGQMFEDVATAWNVDVDKNLKHIITKFSNEQSLSNNRNEMISLVAELKKQPNKRLKRIKLAFGLNGAILLHRSAYAAHNWIYQLIEFFNVADFPIEAYEPFALVSEIQGHMWNLAIEYRPIYFPYRAFVDIGYCSLSSNIIYPMNGCTLRLLLEDCILSIGPVTKATRRSKEFINCDGLVSVLNAGLLNISIRLNDQSKIYPNIDLRSSIHDVHLKTCYDSTDALSQLIAYIANDKDLISLDKKIDPSKSDSRAIKSDHNNEETLEHINKLMADAVKDVEVNPITSHSSNQTKQSKRMVSNETARSQSTSCSCFNSLDECNILDFEPNELLAPCYHQDKEESSLPQIEAELGTPSFHSLPTLEEKDFHVIHDDELFFMDKFGVDQVFVSDDPLQIVDNHFCLPSEKTDLLRPPVHFPVSEESYTLCEMTFTWHLFGGKDFPELCDKVNSKGNTSSSVGSGMSETYKHGVSQAPNESSKKHKKIIPDGSKVSQRNAEVLVEIQLSKIRISHDIYPANSSYSSRQVLIISEIEVRDRLVSSDINKLLYHPFKNNIPQKNNENMVTVKSLNVRSNPNKQSAEECSLKISVLPIRLNIDQDTLLFLEEFFSSLIERSKNVETTSNNDLDLDRDVPVMGVKGMSNVPNEFKNNDLIDRDLADIVEENTLKSNEASDDSSSSDPIYFKEFIFSPALPICFDYHGRRIELSRGPITGLVMGLAQLQGSGISLREVINRRGLLGWNKLFEFLCKEWIKDIKRNQLPNILSGIGPTNAVLQLFQGFFDLFRLPLQQYNKDGRIIRGFQLGAQSFSARTAFAALEITSRIIHLLQFTAETTFDMLSAGPSLNRRRKSKLGKKRQGRPKDLREGVANAYTIVKEGINESANTLVEAAVVEHDQKGYSGAVGAVVRQIPQLVVCPAVLATQATTNILGGAKSSLVPEAKREARNKWKHEKN